MLLLDELRRKMGGEPFSAMMDAVGRAYAGKEITSGQFQAQAEKHAKGRLNGFFDDWLTSPGLPDQKSRRRDRPSRCNRSVVNWNAA